MLVGENPVMIIAIIELFDRDLAHGIPVWQLLLGKASSSTIRG